MHFVNMVADASESLGHHPDICINYTKVRLNLTTKDEGGITDKDLNLARLISSLF